MFKVINSIFIFKMLQTIRSVSINFNRKHTYIVCVRVQHLIRAVVSIV